MGGLKGEICGMKFRQRVCINVGVRTRKKLSDADSFTKRIQSKRNGPVLIPPEKFETLKLWIVSVHAPTETAEDHNKDAFCDELNALISKIPSQQAVIVGTDANTKMGPEQQFNVLGKWFYPMEQTSDNGKYQ
ncbi:hypothetical protein RB195_023338 [Necator americanus]|uniref:Endonuclease/exonuclease/phosphatase domain-containing protein n=1 Tax=Necator americanus TaxID=51031 RepID=A0ABR1EJB4_NECAM